MAYKYDLDITQCAKYLFNDPLNLNLKPPSSNFARKDFDTPRTLQNIEREVSLAEFHSRRVTDPRSII